MEEEEEKSVVVQEPVKRPKVAWSDDLSHDSEEERGTLHYMNAFI